MNDSPQSQNEASNDRVATPVPPLYIPIKDWNEADQPREKLALKGKHALSDAELLAILIGSGSRNESAVALCQRILRDTQHNLNDLGKISIDQLQQYKGIGIAKAITIVAALELGRRRQLSEIPDRPTIRSSKDAYRAIAPTLVDLPHEEFWILLLNRANQVTKQVRISEGGTSGTLVDAKKVYRYALEGQASALILSHNHPSGNLKPSDADIRITRKLIEAGKVLDISVLDHIIVSERGYTSLADEGLMH